MRTKITSYDTACKTILSVAEEYDVPVYFTKSYKGRRDLCLAVGGVAFSILTLDSSANRTTGFDPNDKLTVRIIDRDLLASPTLKEQIQRYQTQDNFDERLFVLEDRYPRFLEELKDVLVTNGFQETSTNHFVKNLGPTKRFDRRRDRWASAGITAKLLTGGRWSKGIDIAAAMCKEIQGTIGLKSANIEEYPGAALLANSGDLYVRIEPRQYTSEGEGYHFECHVAKHNLNQPNFDTLQDWFAVHRFKLVYENTYDPQAVENQRWESPSKSLDEWAQEFL